MTGNYFSLNRIGAMTLLVLMGWLLCEPLAALAQGYNPPRRGTPKRREGAGTRGDCVRGEKGLMPLIPGDGFGAAVSHRPSFFWYVPANKAKTADFMLLDSNSNLVYQAAIALDGTAGIVGVRLPANVTTALETGKDYLWQFSLICDPNQPSKNPFVEGTFQQVQPDPNLRSQIQATPVDKLADLYASAGIWQDEIATLAKQRCDRPNDATLLARWKELLQSGQLDAYVDEPLTQSCAVLGTAPQP